MPQFMVVNPSERPSLRKGVRKMAKHRTAAQKAATRKMIAANRAKARHSNPKRRHKKHARKNPIAATHTYRRATKRRANPVASYRKHRKHRRHNPISTHAIIDLFKNGALGAGGALIVDLAIGNLPLPATLTSRNNADGSINYIYHLTKVGIAVGIGAVGKKVIGAKAEMLALGAVTVNLYDFFRRMMPASIPLGYANPGMPVRANLSMYTGNRAIPSAQGNKTPALNGGNINTPAYPGTGQRLGMYVR